ncbi:MAG TPA: type I-B CRISPR-associated endonuclease Cas1b [Clostridia bacterium]
MQNSYYLFSNGELKRKDNTLRLSTEDGTISDIPIEKVYDIYVFGELNINTALLNLLSKYKIAVHFFNYYEHYIGTYYPKESNLSGALLVNQIQHYEILNKRLKLAKLFVSGSADNILRNLKYYNTRGKELDNSIQEISELMTQLSYMDSISSVMGIEGNIRKNYYEQWQIIINKDIEFEKRVKRPPDNMINSLISLFNSLLYNKIITEIYKTQLTPTISYLHEPFVKRFSLALDISEVFKPLIVDRFIFSLFNKNMIDESDFEKQTNSLKLKESSFKRILKLFDDRLKTTITHRTLNRIVSYRYLIRLELYKLIKHLIGEKEYDPFKIWW